MNTILDKIDSLDLKNLPNGTEALNLAEKIKETEQYSVQLCQYPEMQEKLNLLLKFLKRQKQKLESLYVFRGFLIFIISASFKTAEDMIWKLQDAPNKRLTRRLKYSYELKAFKDGRFGHTFDHNTNPPVPQEFIRNLESGVVSLKNPVESDYFRSVKLMEGMEEDVLVNDSENRVDMMEDDNMDENENNKRNQINRSPTTFLDESSTNPMTDIYDQTKSDSNSPCAIHTGLKLRPDCLICRDKIDEKWLPVKISKAFLKRLNVTESLMKFLADSQDKKRQQLRENMRQDARYLTGSTIL